MVHVPVPSAGRGVRKEGNLCPGGLRRELAEFQTIVAYYIRITASDGISKFAAGASLRQVQELIGTL